MSAEPATTGSCLCGAVRFSFRPPTLYCAHCHCSMCRRAHGAGYVTWFGVPRERFAIEAGESLLTRHRSSEHGTRSFCSRCGSSLFFESTNYVERVEIVLANVHGPLDREPDVHVHFDDHASWVEVDDHLPRLGGATGMEPLPDGGDRR